MGIKGKCPVCGTVGQEVKNITVLNMVFEDLAGQVGENDYYLCRNEGCSIAYFDLVSQGVFSVDQVKVPIWYKHGATPKYICYCNLVTEADIVNALLHHRAKNMKDVIKLTGVMKNAHCEVNNPTGKCCGSVIQQIINKLNSVS